MEPKVIFEDNHLLVVNKPAGWLSQGDDTGDASLVDWAKEYIGAKYNKPGAVFAGLPHRLDRPVSGVMVLCRTSKSLERMTKLFAEKKVSKTYWALTDDRPDNPVGRLENMMVKDRNKNISRITRRDKGAKLAVLTYETEREVYGKWLICVMPETGRPHQIRVQLKGMGCSIVGDLKYGGSKTKHAEAIALHARKIEFIHPVRKEPVSFIADTSTNPLLAKLRLEE